MRELGKNFGGVISAGASVGFTVLTGFDVLVNSDILLSFNKVMNLEVVISFNEVMGLNKTVGFNKVTGFNRAVEFRGPIFLDNFINFRDKGSFGDLILRGQISQELMGLNIKFTFKHWCCFVFYALMLTVGWLCDCGLVVVDVA